MQTLENQNFYDNYDYIKQFRLYALTLQNDDFAKTNVFFCGFLHDYNYANIIIFFSFRHNRKLREVEIGKLKILENRMQINVNQKKVRRM